MILDARDTTNIASVRGILSSFIGYTAFMCVVLVSIVLIVILGIVHPFRLEDEQCDRCEVGTKCGIGFQPVVASTESK
jgi:hypothetical protein